MVVSFIAMFGKLLSKGSRLRLLATLTLLAHMVSSLAGCIRQNYALGNNCGFVASSASGSNISEQLGVNIDFTDPRPGEMKMLSEAGFRWVRMDLKWDATEKEPGRYDFSAYDRLMAAQAPFNIHSLFILDYGNPLYDNGAPPRTQATRQAFTRWAVAAAKHFSGRGVIWEVYNEPNHSTFWPPEPNSEEYVALALMVGRAFRESLPGEKLIGPASSGIDFNFLESCFKAGLLDYWSAVSVHPYRRGDPETAAMDYCRLREMIDRYAKGRQIPIVVGEWGYSSVWPGMSEERQGQMLARSWLTNVANNISLSIWYDWRDDGLDPNEPEHHFGTVFNSYNAGLEQVFNPKPAFSAARTLATFFGGYRFEKRLHVGRAEDYVLVFRKDADLRYAAWTTSTRDHDVLIPLQPGSYETIRHTGQQAAIITADQRGLEITLTGRPVYLR